MTDQKTEKTDTAEPDEADIVLDLVAEDAMLREALRTPSPVRLPGGKVITVPHIADWPHLANRFVLTDNYLAWAKLVLSDEDFQVFQDTDLRNYQMRRIVDVASAAGEVTPGKQRPSSTSRSGTRRR